MSLFHYTRAYNRKKLALRIGSSALILLLLLPVIAFAQTPSRTIRLFEGMTLKVVSGRLVIHPESITSIPTIKTTSSGNNGTSRITSTTVTYPTGVIAGDLVLLAMKTERGNGTNRTITTPTDFTELVNVEGSDGSFAIFYRIATVALSGDFSVSHDSLRDSWVMVRIDGSQGAPEIGTTASGISVNPDPPSNTPSWGSAETLWLAIAGFEGSSGESQAFSAVPTNYTSSVEETGVTSVTYGAINISYRLQSATSEDPGTYTITPSNDWRAQTVALRPG